jgi:hypothetical protein
MTNCISGCQGAEGITKMTVTNATSKRPSAAPVGDDGQQPKSRGLTWEPVMSMGMGARTATMRMRTMKHRKPMMDQHRMLRTEGIVRDVDGYEFDDADVDEEE